MMDKHERDMIKSAVRDLERAGNSVLTKIHCGKDADAWYAIETICTVASHINALLPENERLEVKDLHHYHAEDMIEFEEIMKENG